jgi:hypothetical protein
VAQEIWQSPLYLMPPPRPRPNFLGISFSCSVLLKQICLSRHTQPENIALYAPVRYTAYTYIVMHAQFFTATNWRCYDNPGDTLTIN